MSHSREQPRKRIPTRQCVVCGARRPKIELIRITKRPDGVLAIGEGERGPGRGAYLCRSTTCFTASEMVSRLERGLHQKLSIADQSALAAYARRVEVGGGRDSAGENEDGEGD